MSVDVSVVVPVYNTEPYLRECLDSLVNQTLKNVEFIFVDDGSTDRSYEILREYQQRDDRIQILRQQNLYAGVARNNGMKVATGKYIIFLDSDDFFELDMLEKAFNCAEENQAEIVIFNYSEYNNQDKTETAKRRNLPDGLFSPQQIGDRLFLSINAAPWNKLFLYEFIKNCNIEFQPIQKSNDTLFTYLAVVQSNRIIHIKEELVHYRINNSTSLQGNKGFKRDSFIISLNALNREMDKRGYFNSPFREAYNKYACFLVHLYKESISRDDDIGYKEYHEKIKRSLIPTLFRSPDDFTDDLLIKTIYMSRDYEQFLFLQLKEAKDKIQEQSSQIKELRNKILDIYDSTVSKKSKDYLIGHTAMALPRFVKGLFAGKQ